MSENLLGPGAYALVAEFDDPDKLVEAVRQTRAAGYRKIDAYSPYPIHGMAAALDVRRTWVPQIVFAGGFLGLLSGFALQSWVAGIVYPMNIGGKPIQSWPAWVVPSFELTILFAAFGAVLGMIIMNGLPQPYHPLFNLPRFARASQDRFFLAVEASDPQFDANETRRFLEGLGAYEVSDVQD